MMKLVAHGIKGADIDQGPEIYLEPLFHLVMMVKHAWKYSSTGHDAYINMIIAHGIN